MRWSARRCSPARVRKVLVLERNDRIGGCIRTRRGDGAGLRPRRHGDHVRPVHHIAGASQHSLPTLPGMGWPSPTAAKPTGVLMPDGRALVLGRDRAENIAAFEAAAAGDGDQSRPRHRRGRRPMPDCCSDCLAAGCGVCRRSSCCLPRPGGASPAGWPPSSARRLPRLAPGWKAATGPNRRGRCLRPGCCTPGSDRRTPFPGRSPK